jgi:acetylornithine aminotransferase
MKSENLAARVEQAGERMFTAFRSRLQDNPKVKDIRGRGLMIGIEMDQDVNRLKTDALEQGLLLNVTRNNVIRLLPPLIIDEAQADRIVDTVCKLIESLE